MFTVAGRITMCIAFTLILCFMVIQAHESAGLMYLGGIIISTALLVTLFFIGEEDDELV